MTPSYVTSSSPGIKVNDRVKVPSRPEMGVGEVMRIAEIAGDYQADVAFDNPGGKRLETLPVELLEKTGDLWDRLTAGDVDDPESFRLKQLAYEFLYSNNGGELSASRVNLLPHQILLVHDLVEKHERRYLVADEVGLGKTIETGMLIRELLARGEANRVLIVTPAGLTRNWKRELEECFRLHFEILGQDFIDHGSASWEKHSQVIASIDTLKQQRRVTRIMAAPPWDLVIFDEAHHLSRTKSGGKVTVTQNYKLAEALRGQTRDFLFLTATPHQGNAYQFWSLIQLLNDRLFAGPEDLDGRQALLSRVMIRRIKREVTDSRGNPIFCRRQVTTEPFNLAPRERHFYDELSDYLREGYSAAGVDQKRTTSQQRAIGFVMATFQKIMSSSPRAIIQSLRRRLIVLLARKQLQLEAKRRTGSRVAEEIMEAQDEMLKVASAILGLDREIHYDAEAYVTRIRKRIQKKIEESQESTDWSLDPDEEAEEGVYAEADIPNEIAKVRALIGLVPEGKDRRFDTLMRAISELSRANPNERFIVFTQYRDTLEFLREGLAAIYGEQRVATIKGGPLDDKIAAMEAFWKDDGARFLISTSAGGEGINLQVGRILFNYDLPWNPMAVEQRIGRVHRYGQKETVQIFNLVAEDTVEQRIYNLLNSKLAEIAAAVGKVDESGNPTEDFRYDILGFLGSRPDYQDLYKKALIDKDYKRTALEIQRMIEEAARSREALEGLTQDMSGFNLESYRKLEGHYTLEELGRWVKDVVLKLGGAALPEGEFWTFITPESLRQVYSLSPRYERVCFDREIAMRTRNCELGGMGHPLVDALLNEVRKPAFAGTVCRAGSGQGILAHFLIQYKDQRGQVRGRVANLAWPSDQGQVARLRRFVPEQCDQPPLTVTEQDDPVIARKMIDDEISSIVWELLPDRQSRVGLQIIPLGLARHGGIR